MKKILLLAAAFLGISAGVAQAACSGPAVMHDFPGTAFNMSLASAPDGNCASNNAITTWGGVTLGAASNYGTSPGTVAVPGVNAFVTNTVAVSGTFWQTTQPVSVASGGIASGAYASGAFASGSFASGSIANGANVVEGTITTTHGCLVAGYTIIGCLGQLDDDIKAAGSISQTTQGTTNGVTNGANNTNTVAASATAFVLSATQGGGTGATGDYLSHCVLQPGTTSPGAVTIADNSTTIFSFAGGASSVSNLLPMPIPFGAVSKSGGWKVTTGTNVTLFCVGKFT